MTKKQIQILQAVFGTATKSRVCCASPAGFIFLKSDSIATRAVQELEANGLVLVRDRDEWTREAVHAWAHMNNPLFVTA